MTWGFGGRSLSDYSRYFFLCICLNCKRCDFQGSVCTFVEAEVPVCLIGRQYLSVVSGSRACCRILDWQVVGQCPEVPDLLDWLERSGISFH